MSLAVELSFATMQSSLLQAERCLPTSTSILPASPADTSVSAGQALAVVGEGEDELTEEETLAQAIAMSLEPLENSDPVAKRHRSDTDKPPPAVLGINASIDAQKDELQRALALSLQNAGPSSAVSAEAWADGDDLTRALALSMESWDSAASSCKANTATTFWHYNGLHPPAAEGRSVRVVRMTAYLHGYHHGGQAVEGDVHEDANHARKIRAVLTFRPVPGGSKSEGPWEFLVTCSADGSMETGQLPMYAGKWRCRDCTLLVPPAWNAYNDQVLWYFIASSGLATDEDKANT